MKFIEKYIELRSIVKKWGLKKIKTKNILADWGKLNCQEKVLRNFSGLTMKSSCYWKPLKTWKLKKITRRLQDFMPNQLKVTFWCFYIQLFHFIKVFQTLLNLHWKNILSIIVSFLFSFKLKIIPNYRSRCVSIRFLGRIDSYPIRPVSLSESERSDPSPLHKSGRKKYVLMETDGLSDMKSGTEP